MKHYRLYIVLIAIVSLLFSCTGSEDPLTPSDIDPVSRFTFPEGNDEWDDIFVDIHERYGLYPIYKSWNNTDLSKTWVGGAASLYTFEGRYFENGTLDSLSVVAKFLRDDIFGHVGPDIVKSLYGNKDYLYIVNTYKAFSYGGIAFTTPLMNAIEGMDFVLLSFYAPLGDFGTGHPFLFEDRSSMNQFIQRASMFYTFIVNAGISKKLIAVPSEILTGLDLTTRILVDDDDDNDSDYYLNRGFPDLVPTTFKVVNKPTKIGDFKTAEGVFGNYIRLAMRYDKDSINTLYGNYPIVMEKYNLVVNHMKNNYDIDLQGIAIKKPIN